MALSLLISAWLFGTLGGVHCLAMCGGFVAAAAARDAALGGAGAVPLLPAATIARRQLVYHAGRVSTYAALGAAFGAAGSVALDAALLLPLQRVLYVGANLFLLVLGLSVALGTPGVAGLQRAGAKLFGTMLPALRPLLARPGVAGRIALGLVWGFVPCALVYAVLPLALFAGGAWQGAAVMLAFGAGTVPMLAAASLAIRLPRPVLSQRGWRYVAAAAVIVFSVTGIYRSLFVAGALAQGPFCLID
jgi:sulfite exporter TauE/SafE